MLTKEAILSKDDLIKERVSVPEWGGDVYVSVMTGTARDNYEQSIISLDKNGKAQNDLHNIRAKLVVATVCDENGERLFLESDIESVGKKSAAVLDRLFAVARRLNAVSDNDIEELAKN